MEAVRLRSKRFGLSQVGMNANVNRARLFVDTVACPNKHDALSRASHCEREIFENAESVVGPLPRAVLPQGVQVAEVTAQESYTAQFITCMIDHDK